MSHVPECLKERFKAADELVQELNESKCINENCSAEEPGVKLMCQLWNILRDNPHLNLTEAVREQTKKQQKHNLSIPLNVTNLNLYSSTSSSDVNTDLCSCSSDTNSNGTQCCSYKAPREPPGPDAPPLTKAIYNINEAASIGKKCGDEIKTLLTIQKNLENEVKALEDKDKEIVETLKRTECMWMCMEESYKKKIDEAMAKQETLLKELKEAEASNAKWKKNQKDLELEMTNVDNCHKEMQEKTKEKANDLKSLETEVQNLNKKIADTKTDLESTKKLADNKKKSSDKKLASMAEQVKKLEKTLEDERKRKHEKELEGNRKIKEARDELQYLTTVLMKKKLENGDLAQEKQILVAEMDTLKQMASQCFDKCNDREKSIDEEIARVDKEIAEFQTKFKKHNECTHTLDIKTYCMECPRCIQNETSECCGSGKDCVCMYVKEKFMSNVLENICTMLKKHSQTESGKAVAESVLDSLKRSKDGKLDSDTRKKMQEFIVSATKKNLNDSIVGGAVKTRCELDEYTYNQLMRCLREVKVEPIPVFDGDNKSCCPRFNKVCNCPGGPEECLCLSACQGHKKEPNTKTRARSSNADNEVVLWKTEPCDGGSCKMVSSVRAVQCGLGPEVLTRESMAMSRDCEDCQEQQNILCCSGTGSTVAVSLPCKDVQETKTSLTGENESAVDAKSHSQIAALLPTSIKESTIGCTGTRINTVSFDDKSIHSLKIQSRVFPNIESFFVIKKTNTGHYEMILNKEFENVIKKKLKEHKLDWNNNEDYIFKFKESSSGHRIIDVEPRGDHNKGQRDGVIIRTSSGTLRLFSTDSHSDYQCAPLTDDYTIVTKEDFMNLLSKFQSMINNDPKTKATQTSTCCSRTSKSDSSLYQSTMLNLNNEQCYIEVHELLKRTKSGNFIMTLSKISCKNDTQPGKRNYVKIPITYNKGVTLKHRIKVSACKCAHIIVNKTEIEDIIRNSKLTLKYDSKENIYICKGVQSETSTVKCRSNCGINKLAQKSSSYKQCCQKCSFTNTEKNHKCGVTDESYALILKKLLENPSKCLRHDCSYTDDGSCCCSINPYTPENERQRRIFLLRPFEELPPQLPPFLKGFHLEMA